MVTMPISAAAMLTGPSVMFPTTIPIVAWTDEQCRGSRAQIESRAQIDDLPIEPPGTVGPPLRPATPWHRGEGSAHPADATEEADQ